MKLRYYLEYVNKETQKLCRSDLGYDIVFAEVAALNHLSNGDFNVVIIPALEECTEDDEDCIKIIDVDTHELTEQ